MPQQLIAEAHNGWRDNGLSLAITETYMYLLECGETTGLTTTMAKTPFFGWLT